jgi:SAM-dependent methyltransferase
MNLQNSGLQNSGLQNSSWQDSSWQDSSWQDFWNADTPIYVNHRHSLLHYKLIAEDFADLIPEGPVWIMDYGCGEALNAQNLLSKGAEHIILCDGAEHVRKNLAERFSHVSSITIMSPEGATSLPDQSLDMIYTHSMAQYIAKDEFQNLMLQWHRQLKQDGMLIVSDIIPPHSSAVTDTLALLKFAGKGGFLIAAIMGLVQTAFSQYRTLRQNLGLTFYEPGEIQDLLEKSGFKAEKLAHNPGHNQSRMAFKGIRV